MTPESENSNTRFLPDRIIPVKKRKYAAELFEKGFGYKRVAGILELSAYTVRDWFQLWKQGRFAVHVSKKLYTYTEDFKREVVRLRLSGKSWSQLRRETGVSSVTCKKWIEQFPDEVEKFKQK